VSRHRWYRVICGTLRPPAPDRDPNLPHRSIYAPNPGFYGADRLVYQVESNRAVVNLLVTTQSPLACDDPYKVTAGPSNPCYGRFSGPDTDFVVIEELDGNSQPHAPRTNNENLPWCVARSLAQSLPRLRRPPSLTAVAGKLGGLLRLRVKRTKAERTLQPATCG
jgi:hypothetical protein